MYEYAVSLQIHGDGKPLLVFYERADERFCYVVMQNDIAKFSAFQGILETDMLYDWETPYGYGGPLTDTGISAETQKCFLEEISLYCKSHCIVSQFIRFHPLLSNQEKFSEVVEMRYMRDTIYIDTLVNDSIMKNMECTHRNSVRKAEKNGIKIVRHEITDYNPFLKMYEKVMMKNQAADYYTFDRDYFDYLATFRQNICIFYAIYKDRPISGAIFFFNKHYMHYHLSGSDADYRVLAPSNLLIYQAACWANEQGISKLHLGGGMASDDSLFRFKKSFNKNGRVPFVIGRTIFCKKRYEMLLDLRERNNNNFDRNNGFMIQYRG